MKLTVRIKFISTVTLLLLMMTLSSAQAHLMVGQRGTLNFIDSGAFVVLSVPVTAFKGIDDDGNGMLSMIEYNHHRTELTKAVVDGIRLLDEHQQLPLQGIMLAPSIPDNDPVGSAQHLVVMGRYALPTTDGELTFELSLFGTGVSEQSLSISVTRNATNQTQSLLLTPSSPIQHLFPSSWSVFATFTQLGVFHIFEGLDHLLFLLVVLASGWNLRQVVTVLTIFTIGHASTLSLSVYAGLSAPAALVEPAIIATIIAMAAFDIYSRQTGTPAQPWFRLSLVFGCSLIHGLGLSSVLEGHGLDGQNQLPRLAGFNLGIELGQLLVALIAATIAYGITRVFPTIRASHA